MKEIVRSVCLENMQELFYLKSVVQDLLLDLGSKERIEKELGQSYFSEALKSIEERIKCIEFNNYTIWKSMIDDPEKFSLLVFSNAYLELQDKDSYSYSMLCDMLEEYKGN